MFRTNSVRTRWTVGNLKLVIIYSERFRQQIFITLRNFICFFMWTSYVIVNDGVSPNEHPVKNQCFKNWSLLICERDDFPINFQMKICNKHTDAPLTFKRIKVYVSILVSELQYTLLWSRDFVSLVRSWKCERVLVNSFFVQLFFVWFHEAYNW